MPEKLNINESMKILEQSGILKTNITMNELLDASRKMERIGDVDELADSQAIVHKNYIFINIGSEKVIPVDPIKDSIKDSIKGPLKRKL